MISFLKRVKESFSTEAFEKYLERKQIERVNIEKLCATDNIISYKELGSRIDLII